jgi:hypothetical protein
MLRVTRQFHRPRFRRRLLGLMLWSLILAILRSFRLKKWQFSRVILVHK